MDGVGAGALGRVDDRVGAQVGLRERDAGQPHREVGLPDMGRFRVGFRVHGDRRDPEVAAGVEDPPRDLPAVGDEQPGDHRRNTPYWRAPRTGAEWMADSAIPRTVRVSRGSMTPSSYRRPDKNAACDSSLICASTAARIARSVSSSKSWPRAAAACRATIDRTPASCAGPMTADRAFGHENRKRGPYARPHMP